MPQAIRTVDFEPYFLRWDSVLFYPNPENKDVPLYNYSGNGGGIQCYRHKTCGALVRITLKAKYPMRVCPHCAADTSKEEVDEVELQRVTEKLDGKRDVEDRPQIWSP